MQVKYISYYTSQEYTYEELREKYRNNFESERSFEWFLQKQFRRIET